MNQADKKENKSPNQSTKSKLGSIISDLLNLLWIHSLIFKELKLTKIVGEIISSKRETLILSHVRFYKHIIWQFYFKKRKKSEDLY